MKEEKHRAEYIMNESGLIYAGTYDNMFTWPWNFAQVQLYMCTCSTASCVCHSYTCINVLPSVVASTIGACHLVTGSL